MRDYLSASDISRLEGVTKSTVARWVERGFFSKARKVGGRYKIPIESYKKWVETTKIKVSSEGKDG